MVLATELKAGSPTEYQQTTTGMPLGKFTKGPSKWNLFSKFYEFENLQPGPGKKINGLTKDRLVEVSVRPRTPDEANLSAFELAIKWNKNRGMSGGGRRRTRRMMFKKWAAQEAREMSHKGKRMTFRKWAAHELKEKSHPGNPSFKKWARQEMREKSHTRRRR